MSIAFEPELLTLREPATAIKLGFEALSSLGVHIPIEAEETETFVQKLEPEISTDPEVIAVT